MSAIGDYIHSSAYGYNRYGTNYPGEGFQEQKVKIGALKQSYKKAKMMAQQDAKFLIDKEKIEKQMNSLTKFGGYEEGKDKGLDRIWQVLLEELQATGKMQGNEIKKEIVNLINEGKGASIEDLSKIRIRKGQQTVLISTLVKRILAIKNNIDLLSSRKDYNKIKQSLESIEKDLKDIQVNFKKVASQTEFEKISHEVDFINKKLSLDNNKDLVESINQLIGMINGSPLLKKGVLGQAFIAVSAFVGANYTEQELREAIREAVKEHTSPVSYKIGQGGLSMELKTRLDDIFFSKGKNGKISKNYKLDNSEIIINGSSPDKVDVVYRFHNRNIPMSVKNISSDLENSSPYVNLVSKASLFSLLYYIGPDFSNHYLNVVSQHRNGWEVGTNYINKNTGQAVKGIGPTLLQWAKNAIRLNILLAAFQGHKENGGSEDLKGGRAKVFVAINNVTGKVTIYNIGQLVLKAINTLMYLDPDAVKIQGNNRINIEDVTFQNAFVSGGAERYSRALAYSRIANLMHEVEDQKITVAIKKQSFLPDFF